MAQRGLKSDFGDEIDVRVLPSQQERFPDLQATTIARDPSPGAHGSTATEPTTEADGENPFYEATRKAKAARKAAKEAAKRAAKEAAFSVDDGRLASVEGPRKASYQIVKNKGLLPSRKKEVRNPRVRHRNKFEKATKKRKSQVRAVETEKKLYSGEAAGIRSDLTRSIALS